MVDIKKCPGCKSNTSLSNTTCPYCGYRFDTGPAQVTEPVARQSRCPNCNTPVSLNRSVCPTCRTVLKEKRGIGTYLLIGGFILAAVLLAVFVFQIPGTPPATAHPTPSSAVTAAPTIPTCNLAITGQKTPNSMIQLRLMALTCGPDDVKELRVLLNGQPAGTLPYRLGSSGTYPGRKVSDTVTVVAVFGSGYEKIVFDSVYA
jgi:hypothetical protein